MRPFDEVLLTGELQGSLLIPRAPTGIGVAALGGSSGRVDVRRAGLFAAKGLTSVAVRYFGGDGQPPGLCEIDLQTFALAVDRLVAEGCRQIAIVGTSKGAEAALLTAIFDHRINTVVAISPSSVVWGNIGPGRDGDTWPQRSSWIYQGKPLPFIASDPYWVREYRDGLLSYRSLFEQSLVRFSSETPKAVIPVEGAKASVILVAGGDDALWPSDTFARSIAERLEAHGREASLIFHPDAGHRILFPGETTPRSTLHAHGGNDQADAELGRDAWHAILKTLGLPLD